MNIFLLKFPIYIPGVSQFNYLYYNYNIIIHIHNVVNTTIEINNFLFNMLNYKIKFYKTMKANFSKLIKLVNKSKKKQRRQKGLGKSRVGSLRSSMHKGGGTIFGPVPHLMNLKINKKEWVSIYKSFLINKRSCVLWFYFNKNILNYKIHDFIRINLSHKGINIKDKILFLVIYKNFIYNLKFIKLLFLNINLINFITNRYIIYFI